MTSYRDFHELIQTIDAASRKREIDTDVRAVESAARRSAVAHLRAAAKSQLSHARTELQDLKNQRSFVRRRIRDEMRAQLLNLNADVDRLRDQVRKTVSALKDTTGDLAVERQQRTAAFRASLSQQIAQRRNDTQRLLTEFGDLRAERAAKTRTKLSSGLSELRAATASALATHRAERARLSAGWAAIRQRQAVRSSAPLPLTLSDPRQDLRVAQTLLSSASSDSREPNVVQSPLADPAGRPQGLAHRETASQGQDRS